MVNKSLKTNTKIIKNTKKALEWLTIQGGPQKVSQYQIIKKLCQIVLKSANDMRFLRQTKKMIKHYNIIRQY